MRNTYKILSSKSRNKRLQYYGWRKNLFDQPVKNYLRRNENIQKIATVQGDDYTTVCFLDYNCFKEHKLSARTLSEQQSLDVDPIAIQQINFTGNLEQKEGATMLFFTEESQENFLDFSLETVRVFQFCFVLRQY